MSQEKLEIIENVLIEKNMTFLLGAGASAPYFSSLGNYEIILSHKNLNELGKILIRSIFFTKSIEKNKYLLKYIFDNQSLLLTDRQELVTVLHEYKRYIHNLIEHLKVRNSRISPKRVNIVTTNYDIFIETAIDEILENNPRFFFNDGSNGYNRKILNTDNFNKTLLYSGVFDNYSNEMPAINLIKCHGSINWQEYSIPGKSRSTVQVINNPEVINEISSISGNLELKINDIIKNTPITEFKNVITKWSDIIKLLDNNISEDLIEDLNTIANYVKTDLSDLKEELDKLQIVFPTKKKFQSTLVEEQYFSLLRLLSYELEKEQSVLIAFGFSFYDEHITEIVQRSLNNPNLLVIIFCFKDINEEEITSNFNFDENSIPKNVIFIKPNDFLKETTDLENYTSNYDDQEMTAPNIIVTGEEVKIYSDIISFLENDVGKTAVLDFNSFNLILESGISNVYIDNYDISHSNFGGTKDD